MTRARKVATGCGAVFAVILIALAAAAYTWGPATTAIFTGKTQYVIKPSPQKYAKDVIRIVETLGIYAESDEFTAAKATALEEIKGATSYEETYEPLRAVIKAAGGKHSNILTAEDEAAEDPDQLAPAVEARGNIAFATVPDVTRHDDGQAYADTLTEGILTHATCGAIVDLRGNGGGDMGPMVAGISPLLPDGPVLSFVSRTSTTDVTVDGNSVTGGGTPVTTQGGKREVPVAVLVDAETASSGEATMLTFRGLDRSRSFGEPTAGFASANMVVDLYDGASVMITTAKDRARTGEEFAEDPVRPDVATNDAEREAVAWLEGQGCSTQ
ncbi:S41 family peptidase [Corynebacterium timonense]|uniref:Peptidase family S41 n=1 Tax=Corynebacterium timonense TaxID=441500 RepID=A0A1H1TXX9_9CORY|nr:S41 family peptidase [Corynebacterium timonense]SDS65063.1 Peptidase family S41 [Corynebacterium timonense]